MSKAEQLKDFLLRNIIKGEDDIDFDESLINSGLVDSFGLLEMVTYIEDAFGVRVEDYEILDAEADTLNLIVDLIERAENE